MSKDSPPTEERLLLLEQLFEVSRCRLLSRLWLAQLTKGEIVVCENGGCVYDMGEPFVRHDTRRAILAC